LKIKITLIKNAQFKNITDTFFGVCPDSKFHPAGGSFVFDPGGHDEFAG
jgi:hypothetical protein